MRCVAICKLNIVRIYTMKRGDKKIGYHTAIGVSIDRNGCAVIIFKGIWDNDALASQAAPNSHL